MRGKEGAREGKSDVGVPKREERHGSAWSGSEEQCIHEGSRNARVPESARRGGEGAMLELLIMGPEEDVLTNNTQTASPWLRRRVQRRRVLPSGLRMGWRRMRLGRCEDDGLGMWILCSGGGGGRRVSRHDGVSLSIGLGGEDHGGDTWEREEVFGEEGRQKRR